MCDINMITKESLAYFSNSLIVLDDMGEKFCRKNLPYCLREGRNHSIQLIVMC